MQNAFLKLPFHFSEEKLLKDLEVCRTYNFTSHFNKNDYSGEWTSIALRSQNGEIDNIFALPQTEKKFKDTQLLQNCAYFKEIIDAFKCEKESIRLLNLKPDSEIKEHTDYNLGYEDGVFRIHIPITTNSDVHFFINSEEIKMLPSECWYGNFNLPHSVKNDGETDRIHLIMDCFRNDWSDNLFAESGYNFEVENHQPEYSREAKLQMIEELKLMDTEISKAMILELQKDLKKIQN
ncbi:aspartyl/asparaginyl beta-hydroxylase domain-containing protein [Aequorivita sp. F47161]|uniref:Aspartyl/asparaginyl beta-hydroxylase domain-containing protein n=1 Tax=Aequorivita vitellina TaxID=2874475 RepID=A0A9X1QVZ2_9FLAO|nr:aspartyl/asparaginyl beta-hydroxylase domain-containing protein [Aequorivita vitellina]MCG2419325.1 aspartyl/asparaginyl beta-hydroxylase domain-containing protein [Aequorivita vitellina]